MDLGDYKHILRLTKGTQKGKERNQNGISRNTPENIWKFQHRCIIFEGRLNDTKNVRQCLAFFNVRWSNRYTGCIYRYTCTTLGYIRRKKFGGIENYTLSLPLKRKSRANGEVMTGHALFLAMDDFFSSNRELF